MRVSTCERSALKTQLREELDYAQPVLVTLAQRCFGDFRAADLEQIAHLLVAQTGHGRVFDDTGRADLEHAGQVCGILF